MNRQPHNRGLGLNRKNTVESVAADRMLGIVILICAALVILLGL